MAITPALRFVRCRLITDVRSTERRWVTKKKTKYIWNDRAFAVTSAKPGTRTLSDLSLKLGCRSERVQRNSSRFRVGSLNIQRTWTHYRQFNTSDMMHFPMSHVVPHVTVITSIKAALHNRGRQHQGGQRRACHPRARHRA